MMMMCVARTERWIGYTLYVDWIQVDRYGVHYSDPCLKVPILGISENYHHIKHCFVVPGIAKKALALPL